MAAPMKPAPASPSSAPVGPAAPLPGWGLVALLLLITGWRLAVIAAYPYDIYADEAQYWAWSQHFAFGYFSKPPLVAWIIALTTHLFGDTEFGIKAAAPVLQLLIAGGVWLVARQLYDGRVAFWAALTWILLPGVTVSGIIISTDPPMMLFWALSLAAVVRALAPETRRPTVWWGLAGVAFGLSLLGKYTAIFLPVSLGLYLLWSPDHRRWLARPGPWVMLAVGALFYLPNVLWNAANDWVSYAHTGANANLGGPLFNLAEMGGWLGGQFGVFGPFLFLVLLGLMITAPWRARADERQRLLLSFVLPLFLIILTQSLLSRAHANWAAPVYIAGTVATVGWLLARRWGGWLLVAATALHLVLAFGAYNFERVAPLLLGGPVTEKSDPYRRVRGWEEAGARLADVAAAHPDLTPAFLDRETMASLYYYMGPAGRRGVMFNPHPGISDYYDMMMPLTPETPGPFLLITQRRHPEPFLKQHFETVTPLEVVRLRLPTGQERTFQVLRITGRKNTESGS